MLARLARLVHDRPEVITGVHAGHDPSFGRDRLRQLAAAYLQGRRP
jgi:hypothetical protein